MIDAVPVERVKLVSLPLQHRATVRGWLARPECVGWWGTPAAAFARSQIALDSTSAVCRLVLGDGAPVGYADALEIGGDVAPRDIRRRAAGDLFDPGVWDLAVFIGLEAFRGCGVGSHALTLLADELFSTTLALGAAVRVPIRSERAARAVEAAGFRWNRIDRTLPDDPAWIFLRDRPRN